MTKECALFTKKYQPLIVVWIIDETENEAVKIFI